MIKRFALAALMAAGLTAGAHAQDATFSVKVMTPETALKAAQAALDSCRAAGYQVAVAVVDRFGTPQVLLRDRFAGPHTPDTATRKAWTAVSFRSDTQGIVEVIENGEIPVQIALIDQAMMIGGGVQMLAGGSSVGGIGVSGAPNGGEDHKCAQAGVEAVATDLAF